MSFDPVPADAAPELTDALAAPPAGAPSKAEAQDRVDALTKRLDQLQEALYAEGTRALLVIFQGRDTAGKDGATLDRTPMPGEPHGAINGGYAGLSARLAPAPAIMAVMTTEGPVTEFRGARARPNAAAVAGNFSLAGRDVGGIAILSDPANIAEQAPWYIIDNTRDFRFLCAAILAPAVRTIPPHGELALRYRVAIKPTAWTQAELRAAIRQFVR